MDGFVAFCSMTVDDDPKMLMIRSFWFPPSWQQPEQVLQQLEQPLEQGQQPGQEQPLEQVLQKQRQPEQGQGQQEPWLE